MSLVSLFLPWCWLVASPASKPERKQKDSLELHSWKKGDMAYEQIFVFFKMASIKKKSSNQEA